MKLREYIKSNGMTIRGFSKKHNLNHRNVEMWCRGERMPNYKDAFTIFNATENVVTGHDFYLTYDERFKLNEKKRTEVVA